MDMESLETNQMDEWPDLQEMLQTMQAQVPPVKKGVTMLAQKFSKTAGDMMVLA